MQTLEATAARLFADLMAPLVLGGEMRPGRVIGARAALALAALPSVGADPSLEDRVRLGRLHQARKLVPIDEFGPPSGAEWMLAAALHDILQSANPSLDTALRRRTAQRIAQDAEATIDRVSAPAHTLEALSRHSWFARVLEIKRRDTHVSWWIGSRTLFGVDAPARLLTWPRLRNVKTVRSTRALVELTPLAIARECLVRAVDKILDRTPLTSIATCTRAAPPFAWGAATLALVATRAGRALALRAIERLPTLEADAALGRATRQALARWPGAAQAAVALLGDRAILHAQTRGVLARDAADLRTSDDAPSLDDAAFARRIGAAAAKRALSVSGSMWPEVERQRLLGVL